MAVMQCEHVEIFKFTSLTSRVMNVIYRFAL